MNKAFFTTVFSILFLFSAAQVFAKAGPLTDASGRVIRRGGKYDSRPVYIIPAKNAPANEFRGVWISTVKNLDFPVCRSAAEFKKRYTAMIKQIATAKFTAVIFQIRPTGDAFYPSQFAPVSQWLTGKEGFGFRNFDPLDFMIRTAHAHRLEFHAWLNPYRVMNDVKMSKTAFLKTRHPANFARRNPHLVLGFKDGASCGLFLDPGRPEVIRHVLNVVNEIVMKYRVDAIHFDDYFYPYDEIGNLDNATFARFNPYKLSKANWRRHNTETLIANVRRVIDNANTRRGTRIRFGISPFGIWGNAKDIRGGSATGGKQSYFNLYADTRKWVKRGYLDYIVPQIYWNFAHETAAYAALVDWWSATVRNTRTRLYIGMASYRLGAVGWGNMELSNQLKYNWMSKEVSGFILFSYRHVFGSRPHAGIRYFFQNLQRSDRQYIRR